MANATKLTQEELNEAVIASLGNAVQSHNGLTEKPFVVSLRPPLPPTVRIYIYNATRPPGGRPVGEHKIQPIVPGQARGETGNFDDSGGAFVLLVGYDATLDVFILWDAGLYRDFSYSRNVQVKGETVYQALSGNIVEQRRRLRGNGGTHEIVLAAESSRLADAIQLRFELTYRRLVQK